MKPASVLKEKALAHKAKRARDEQEYETEMIKAVWRHMEFSAEKEGATCCTIPNTICGRSAQAGWSPPVYQITGSALETVLAAISKQEGYRVEVGKEGEHVVHWG